MVSPMVLLGHLILAATAGPPAVLAVPEPEPAPIYGGEQVADGEWPGVVALDLPNLLCTGTLIHPRLVLTAAHCLRSQPDPANIRVKIGTTILEPEFETVGARYAAHPDFCGDLEVCKADTFDFGYVVLAEAVPPAYPPLGIVTQQEEWDALMVLDAPITMVGFGLNEGMLMGIKRIAETTLVRRSDTGLEFQAGGMGVDSCQGDSGGPAFVHTAEGVPLLAGVLSRGYACGDGGIYGIPAPILCWVSEDAGVEVRDLACFDCQCLDPSPQEEGCERCAVTPGRAGDGLPAMLIGLVPLGLAIARRRPRSSR